MRIRQGRDRQRAPYAEVSVRVRSPGVGPDYAFECAGMSALGHPVAVMSFQARRPGRRTAMTVLVGAPRQADEAINESPRRSCLFRAIEERAAQRGASSGAANRAARRAPPVELWSAGQRDLEGGLSRTSPAYERSPRVRRRRSGAALARSCPFIGSTVIGSTCSGTN